MCDFASLTKKMFEALEDIEAGRFVFVIAARPSAGSEVAIEDVFVDETTSPQLALERHCKAYGLAIEDRLCLPVVLPPSLKVKDVRGFRSVRTKKAIWIEYTGTI